MDNITADRQLAYKTRALEAYKRLRILDAQRQSNNRSLMLAAAGVVVLVGGAAVTVAEKPATSQAGLVIALFGCLTEFFGLIAFVKSA